MQHIIYLCLFMLVLSGTFLNFLHLREHSALRHLRRDAPRLFPFLESASRHAELGRRLFSRPSALCPPVSQAHGELLFFRTCSTHITSKSIHCRCLHCWSRSIPRCWYRGRRLHSSIRCRHLQPFHAI